MPTTECWRIWSPISRHGTTPRSWRPHTADGASVGNTGYALPYGFYLRAMFINRVLFKQAGIDAAPTTMDEFTADAKKVSALPGKYGYCLRGGPGGLNGWVCSAPA